ncbi:MAG: hypothetical protein ACOC38_11155 [Promethearchaeia archaeon]
MSTEKPSSATGSREYVYLTLYRLKDLKDKEKRDWFEKWSEIRNSLPEGIRIVTEAGNAFGTDFTGFTVFEGPFEAFGQLMSTLERYAGALVEKTYTIIGTKGLFDPYYGIKQIMEKRPID